MTPHLGRLSPGRSLDYLSERLPGPGMVIVPAGSPVYGASVYPAEVAASPATYRSDLDAVVPRPPSSESESAWSSAAGALLAQQAAMVHEADALLVGQIHHPGAERSWDSLQPSLAPSAVDGEWPVQHPHEPTDAEIGDLVTAYAANAAWIVAAGADGVEIHAAHGYLLNRFISPFYNRRSGRYGGSVEGRWRLLSEIVLAVREAIGTGPILGVRVPPFELTAGGLTTEELVAGIGGVAASLSYVNLSVGNHDGLAAGAAVIAYTTPWLDTRPSLAHAADAVRASTEIPVLVTGGVNSAADVERMLDSGADLVGIARAAIADPKFAAKVLAGGADIAECIGCNECTLVPFSCPVNPAAGREAELRPSPAPRRRVVVVGGGPAGLSAALAAAARGHDVRLLEREDHLGGVLAQLVRDPARARWAGWLSRLERTARSQVQVELGTDVHAALADVVDADAVIVATGGLDRPPQAEMEVDGSVPVLSSLDVLAGIRPDGQGVILVAGGTEPHLDPLLTARLLASEGLRVVLITELVSLGPTVEQRTLNVLSRLLAAADVDVRLSTRITGAPGGYALLKHLLSGRSSAMPVAGVVLAHSRRPAPHNGGLAALLQAARGEAPTFVVGDALAPRRLTHAVLEGTRFGNSL